MKQRRPNVGNLPAKYSLLMNPHASEKLSRCPYCGKLS